MFGTHDLGVFVIAGLLVNITPGQDTFYILGRTLSQGRAAGVYSVLGISAGCLVHTVLAAVGLSAVLATSAIAFSLVTYVGAAYLVWLGINMWRSSAGQTDVVSHPPESGWRVFRAGMLTNVLNPKVALFFMAFLPQFVVPDASTQMGAFLFLGLVFVINGTLWCLVLVGAASAVGGRLRKDPRVTQWLNRVAAVVFVALGIRLALSR